MGFAVFIHFHEVELSENDRKSLAQKMYEFAPIRECISHGPYIVTYRDMSRYMGRGKYIPELAQIHTFSAQGIFGHFRTIRLRENG